MPTLAQPLPQLGRQGHIELIDYALELVPETYEVREPTRVGEKISTGDVRYADFNPYESVSAQAAFYGGYGLQRYSDQPDPQVGQRQILEALGVDCRSVPVTLSPALVTETLPASTGTPVWLGEVQINATSVMLAVAGNQLFQRTGTNVWVARATLAGTAIKGAVGVFNGTLTIGYGAAVAAQKIIDTTWALTTVQNDAAASLYIWAFTSDRAAAYAAAQTAASAGGGANTVMSSTDGLTWAASSATICGSSTSTITSLAPGGGAAILFVGKASELGMIDRERGTYRVAVPYASTLPTNSQPLQWWLASAADQQQGPLQLFFTRDRAPWVYQPGAQGESGQAQNVAPWADPVLRAPNIRGLPTAFQGTARFLYMVLKNKSGRCFVVARDSRTGAWTPLHDLGSNDCQALALTSTVGVTNPLLFTGYGNNIAYWKLPLDGDATLDDAACPFGLAGTLDLPAIDLGLPDEDKLDVAIRVVADGLLPNHQTIRVSYAADDSTLYTPLGTADASPRTELTFPPTMPLNRRLKCRLTFTTDDASKTPQLWAFIVRATLNTRLMREWRFEVFSPAGQTFQGDDLTDGYTVRQALWAARKAGTSVAFRDDEGDPYNVRILEMGVKTTTLGGTRPPEKAIALRLLELVTVAAPTYTTTYALGAWSTGWFPMGFPGNGLGPSTISNSDTVVNGGPNAIYPVVTIHGPGYYPTLTNVTTGEVWTLNYEIPAGATVTVDFTPGAHSIVDQDSTDLTGYLAPGAIWWGFGAGSTTSISVLMGRATTASSIQIVRSSY